MLFRDILCCFRHNQLHVPEDNMAELNTNTEEIKDIVESEDVMEVALDDSEENSKSSEGMEYTEAEMSGLTEQQRKRKEIWDKVTTGILIALLCSPVAILLYIFIWFIQQMG